MSIGLDFKKRKTIHIQHQLNDETTAHIEKNVLSFQETSCNTSAQE
jgi:hypothetical protein